MSANPPKVVVLKEKKKKTLEGTMKKDALQDKRQEVRNYNKFLLYNFLTKADQKQNY